MEQIEQWITARKIPIGAWAKNLSDWATDNLAWFFDAIVTAVKGPIEATSAGLLAIPPLIFVVGFAIIAFIVQRSWKLALFIALGLLFILNQGLWKEMIETLVLAIYATVAALAIGIPTGIVASRRKWIYTVLSPILDLMQTLPTFIYLVPMLVFLGLGIVPGIIATVVFAVPAAIRATYLGLSEVPRPLIEAGDSFGCTRWQRLTRVELPAAMPTIMLGVNQTIMLSLSMVVIAALVGAGGLGKPVVRALNTVNIPLGVESGLAIVVVAVILDRLVRRQRAKAKPHKPA